MLGPLSIYMYIYIYMSLHINVIIQVNKFMSNNMSHECVEISSLYNVILPMRLRVHRIFLSGLILICVKLMLLF